MTQKSEIRALEYRTRAEAATAMALGSVLDHAREQHERSAAAWTELADAEERRAVHGRVFLGAVTATGDDE
jgi:hypothetical protein